MSARPWYKRYPSNFIAGTIKMPLELAGAYSYVLDLIYDKGGPVDDDPQWLSRVCGCSVRRWKQHRAALLDLGKITLTEDGLITNARAERQMHSEGVEAAALSSSGARGGSERQKKSVENLAKVGDKPEIKSAKVEDKDAEKTTISADINDVAKKGLDDPAKHTRARLDARYQKIESKKDSPVPPPSLEPARPVEKPEAAPKRGAVKSLTEEQLDRFETWWQVYPRKVAKGAARTAYAKAEMMCDPGMLLARAGEVEDRGEYTPHPATWLNKERWLDEVPMSMKERVMRAAGLDPATGRSPSPPAAGDAADGGRNVVRLFGMVGD